ncbi:F0F1 ATP synthase subunit delta [Rubritalea marina]|uniref:F0F1 ATP synthase subunit delta n=1 Tax=Rubritalea marina TaxID=361055 RepID=UPI0003772F1E|nr:F0F1 ATP synthase subunit delta [Rubritalea marina]
MKVSKDAAAAARRLYNLCKADGKVDEAKFSKVVKTIAERKPRNFRGILVTLKRLLEIDLAAKHVTVDSAAELDTTTKQGIVTKLTAKFGDDLTFEYRVNSALLGGIRIRKGDDVWDGTIKSRLENIANAF